jgi:hypothetical protein
MDILEKAKIRMESWIKHNEHHKEEYEMLADELEAAGKTQSTAHVREMTDLMKKSNECLRNALKYLD